MFLFVFNVFVFLLFCQLYVNTVNMALCVIYTLVIHSIIMFCKLVQLEEDTKMTPLLNRPTADLHCMIILTRID